MIDKQIIYLTDRIFVLERQRDRQRMLGRLSDKDAGTIALDLQLLRRELQLRIRETKTEQR
jgi:hypothetical protein